MISYSRRTFLKIGSILTGGLVLSKYTEPIVEIVEPYRHRWVEDMGDFYIVRVPDSKSFSNELLDKPTIFLLERFAIVNSVSVIGYSNISHKGQSKIYDCMFDCSEMVMSTNRAVLHIDTNKSIEGIMVENICVKSNYLYPATSAVSIHD